MPCLGWASLYTVIDSSGIECKMGVDLFCDDMSVFCFSEPYFVQAVNYGEFIYFFYREIGMEYNTMGKVS